MKDSKKYQVRREAVIEQIVLLSKQVLSRSAYANSSNLARRASFFRALKLLEIELKRLARIDEGKEAFRTSGFGDTSYPWE